MSRDKEEAGSSKGERDPHATLIPQPPANQSRRDSSRRYSIHQLLTRAMNEDSEVNPHQSSLLNEDVRPSSFSSRPILLLLFTAPLAAYTRDRRRLRRQGFCLARQTLRGCRHALLVEGALGRLGLAAEPVLEDRGPASTVQRAHLACKHTRRRWTLLSGDDDDVIGMRRGKREGREVGRRRDVDDGARGRGDGRF